MKPDFPVAIDHHATKRGRLVLFQISPEDYPFVKLYEWSLNNSGYVSCSKGFLHRLLIKPLQGLQVDHIDGNKLNNARSNLRIVTRSQNNQGIKKGNNSSGYVGVTWNKDCGKWQAQLSIQDKGHRKNIYLGTFYTLENAISARKEGEKKYGFIR